MTKAKSKAKPRIKPHGQTAKPGEPVSSLRAPTKPRLSRNVWLIGFHPERLAVVAAALAAAGHEYRTAETSSELAPNLRDFRPDLIVIDMAEQPDRGRHTGQQLRADRATRQVPIVLTGLAIKEEADKSDKQITGPTRRYVLPLDAPSVVNAILAELH
jgi:CheY-like chemotaxis protein